MVDEKKSKERLKKFQSQKNPAKKWKCMRKILEKDTPENVKQFWKQNAEEILNCTIAYTSLLETTKDADKLKKPQEQEVSAVLTHCKEILDQLHSQVASKWRSKDFHNLFSRFLAKSNKAIIRKTAFELMCNYMEILFEAGGGVELDSMLQLLRQSINLHVLLPEVPGATPACIKETMAPLPANLLLVPSTTEPTIQETTEMFDSLLAAVTNATAAGKSPSIFDWWLTVLKTSYLVMFYPEVWKRVGLLNLADSFGFPVCPASIQVVLIRRIESWRDNKLINDTLWNESNAPFSMEVLRQACELPLTHADVMLKAIDTYKYHLLLHRNAAVLNEGVSQGYWRDLVTSTSRVLTIDPQPKFAEAHSKLISATVTSYEYLTFNYMSLLTPETWRHLQFVLLESTMTFLRKNQGNMLSDNKNDIVRNADEIIGMLFTVWIRSPVTTQDMWNDFHKYFSSSSDWPHSIRQWRLAVLKLTGILVKYTYCDKPILISVVEPSRRPTIVATRPSTSGLSHRESTEITIPSTPRASIAASTPRASITPRNTIQLATLEDSEPLLASSSSTPSSSASVPTDIPPSDALVIEVTKDEFLIKFAGVSAWSKSRIMEMWMTVLHIVGNVNAIKSALNFELAMRCVSDVVAMLLEGEATLPLSSNYRRIHPIDIFFPWLMEACFATGEKIRGVIIAFQVLCQLFCCQHGTPLSTELLAHFYRAIQVGLKNDNAMVRDQIITEARQIFSFGLPGVTVLIPDLLTEIASIFKSRATVPEVQKHAMTLFNSLICYVNHHRDIEIPDIGKIHQLAQIAALNPAAAQSTADPVITSGELRDTVAQLMASFLNNNMDPSAKGHILWGACVMLLEEISNDNPRMPTTTQCLQALLFLARHPHDGVAVNAANVLTTLAEFFNAFNALDKNLPYSMINLISDTITFTFGNNGGQSTGLRDSVIVALFESLTAWISAGANDFLRDKSQGPRVFNAIELGLFGVIADPSKLANQSSTSKIHNEEDHLTSPLVFLMAQLRERPSHSSSAIKAAAETALYTALELNNNFPTPAGATMIDSATVEIPELPVAFFINNHEQLFSCQILGHPDAANKSDASYAEASLLRVIVRDTMGKHCWDMSIDYKEHPDCPKTPSFDDSAQLNTKVPQPDAVPKKTDLLYTLLTKYDEKHLDCLPQTPKFTKFTLPPNPDSSYAAEIDSIKSSIVSTIANDEKLWTQYDETRPQVNNLQHNSPEPVSSMSLARIALSHLGYLSPMSRRNFHLVEDCDDLRAKIADLDKLAAREQHSISVRYVGPGQEERFEETMKNGSTETLANGQTKPSAMFDDFISGLGWRVNLEKHRGFKGHLSKDTAKEATYYATATSEVIFEVLPRIETPEIRKLVRDQNVVEIVWSEHRRPYVCEFPNLGLSASSSSKASGHTPLASGNVASTPRAPVKTISSISITPIMSAPATAPLSLDISIGIYPLPNGQFRVSVLKRESLANAVCGPLMNGMVVSKNLLPTLVRLTAAFSRRKALSARQPDLKTSRVARLLAIRAISQEFRSPKAGELFYSHLFPLNSFPEMGVCKRLTTASSRTSTSYVPGMVDAAKAEAEARAAAAAAAASSNSEGSEDISSATNPDGSPMLASVKPKAAHPKFAGRSYGVSRSAGSGRSLMDLTRQNSGMVSVAQAAAVSVTSKPSEASAPDQTTAATASTSATLNTVESSGQLPQLAQTPPPAFTTAATSSKPATTNNTVSQSSDSDLPPPPPSDSLSIEEVVLSTGAPLDLSPFDASPFDAPFTPVESSPFSAVPSPQLAGLSASADPVSASANSMSTVATAAAASTTNTQTASMEASKPSTIESGQVKTIPVPSSITAGSPKGENRNPGSSKLTASFKLNRPASNSTSHVTPNPAASAATPATSTTVTAAVAEEATAKHSPPVSPTVIPAEEQNRTPSQSSTVPLPAETSSSADVPGKSQPPPAALPKTFGGPGKLPSGFKVPFGVGGNFKVPAGVAKAQPQLPGDAVQSPQ